jgi:uncharacterized membrane protein
VTGPGGTGLPRQVAGRGVEDLGAAGLQRSIARLLTIGTYVSIALLAVGVALMLGAGIGPLSGGPVFDVHRLFDDLLAARPAGFIWIGLLVVVATPSARVAASLVGFARRGDRAMVAIASLVLIVIAVSVAAGQLES